MYKKFVVCICVIYFTISAGVLSASDIHEAAKKGDKEKIEKLLESDPALLDQQNEKGLTLLHFACAWKQEEIGKFLINKGANLKLKSKLGTTALHFAASSGSVVLTKLILENEKGNINTPASWDNTALHLAGESGHSKVVTMLIEAGASIEQGNAMKRTPLIASAREAGDLETIKVLLKHGANIDAQDNSGDTALSLAAWRGFTDLTNYLVRKKAKIFENQQLQLLGFATSKNLPVLYNYLLQNGLKLEDIKDDNKYMVHSAAAGGGVEIVKSLISKGFDYKHADKNGWTPLHHAAAQGKTKVITFLIEKGIDKNVVNIKGETAYHLAEFREFPEAAKLLKENNVFSGTPKFPELKGEYMGQKPPGDEPMMFLPGVVSGNYKAHCSVVFSPDGKEAYWTEMYPPREKGYGSSNVMGMKKNGDKWTYPEKSTVMRSEPFFAPDGKRLYFLSRNPIKKGSNSRKENIWVMDKTESGWSEAKPLGPAVNNNPIHWAFSVDKKGSIYFADWKTIYISQSKDGKYQKAVDIAKIYNNPTLSGNCPFISPDGDYLIFTSPEKEGSANDELFISFRRDNGSWTDRINLGQPINGTKHDLCPVVTPDGKYLFYTSYGKDRPWGIYWVSANIIKKLKQKHISKGQQ